MRFCVLMWKIGEPPTSQFCSRNFSNLKPDNYFGSELQPLKLEFNTKTRENKPVVGFVCNGCAQANLCVCHRSVPFDCHNTAHAVSGDCWSKRILREWSARLWAWSILQICYWRSTDTEIPRSMEGLLVYDLSTPTNWKEPKMWDALQGSVLDCACQNKLLLRKYSGIIYTRILRKDSQPHPCSNKHSVRPRTVRFASRLFPE